MIYGHINFLLTIIHPIIVVFQIIDEGLYTADIEVFRQASLIHVLNIKEKNFTSGIDYETLSKHNRVLLIFFIQVDIGIKNLKST